MRKLFVQIFIGLILLFSVLSIAMAYNLESLYIEAGEGWGPLMNIGETDFMPPPEITIKLPDGTIINPQEMGDLNSAPEFIICEKTLANGKKTSVQIPIENAEKFNSKDWSCLSSFEKLFFSDPAGDSTFLFPLPWDPVDLLEVTYDLQGDTVIITQTYERDVTFFDSSLPMPPPDKLVVGVIEFDLDRDTSTGDCFGCIFGADYAIGAERTFNLYSITNGESQLGDGYVAKAFDDGNTLRFEIPAGWLYGGDCLNMGTIIGDLFGPTDYAPNEPGTAMEVLAGCS